MKLKRLGILTALLLCMTALCGCGDSFDAAALLRGNLDLIYRNEYTPEFLESAGFSPEEAEQKYRDGIEAELEVFGDYFGVDLTLCGEEAKEKIRAFYRTAYSHAKYEVGSAVKGEDVYTVEVTVQPIDIMQKFRQLDADAFMAAWELRYRSGEFDAMSSGEYETAWLTAVLEALRPRLEDVGHLAAETVPVRVEKSGEDGVYSVSAEDLGRIDGLMIGY